MPAPSETGNAKNVANFLDLATFCAGYGAQYNPNNTNIVLPQLTTLHTNAKAALATINTLFPPYSNAVKAREAIFSPLSKLVTRIVNAAEASDLTQDEKAGIKTIARKLQGKRATPKTETPDDGTTPPDPNAPTNISASQMSFDSRVENMDKLLELLKALPNYNPNETDLNVTGIATLLTNMQATNDAVVVAYTPLSNARIARDLILYTTKTGLVDIAADVKAYVKSVFGATSPQYKQVSGLKFSKPKK